MSGRDQLVVKVNEKIKSDPGLESLKPQHVDLLSEAIVEMVKGGDRVTLQGFGSFFRRPQAARVARNPKTGEPIQVSARVRLDFQATVPAFDLTDEETAKLAKAAAKAAAPAKPAPAPAKKATK
jgi:DNA-binding protein HU-beta